VRALSTARRCPILCVLELARATDARADGTCLRPAEPGATTAASRGRAVALDLLPASSTSVAVRLGPRGASGARALDPTVRSWAEMTEVLRASSAASALGGWAPLGLIVKAEASMAVEQLVQRLLCEAQAIFELERAPLRLRPYEVRCYGPSCGFVEFVPDAPSLHALRQRLGSASLSVHWRAAYGERGSAPHARALANFASSLAAYGATCYALAVKDRHNGNILLHASGHLVHVDFGYVLGDAPGGRVERAPFKLTAEWLELLSGGDTEAPELRRFRTLCAVALLALRRHAHRLLAPLETAAALCARGGAAAAALLPCMCAGDASVCAGVRARLMLELDDDAACAAAERLVDASAESWGTWAYDAYQRVAHGIE
jgi:phosphatidylinositol 4-kinase